MLGKAQNFINIDIKLHILSCLHFSPLSLAYFGPFLFPFCQGGLEQQMSRIITCTGWKSSWPPWSHARKAGLSGSHFTWRESRSPFLCSEISSSQAGVKAGILASRPVPCAAHLLLTPKPTFRCLLLHITDVLQIHSTLLSCPHTQDKFKPTVKKGITP